MRTTGFSFIDTTHRLRFSAVAVCALAATGCAEQQSDEAAPRLESISCPADAGSEDADDAGDAGMPDGSTPPLDGGLDSGTPDAGTPDAAAKLPTYVTGVTANGTGCPAGSWKVDGEGNITFDEYEVSLAAGANGTQQTLHCQLAIQLAHQANASYAVESFGFSPYVFLEPGTSFTASARYYWQGNPVAANDTLRSLQGPYDNDAVLSDDVSLQDRVWSPCGVSRDLNVSTMIHVAQTQARAAYAQVSTIALKDLKLAVRACSARE